MRLKPILGLSAAVALAVPLAAQMFGPRVTLSGVWHPVVGSGAAYEQTVDGKEKNQLEITVVGKEDVGGKTGYWVEMMATQQGKADDVLGKTLMVVADEGITATKAVFQMAGQPPMEMDLSMGPGARAKQNFSDITEKAQLVGTETITVPAGTFTCQHYHMKDNSGDGWISDKITPWSLVKSQDKNSTVVLVKVITDAKDRITGTPTKFDPSQMMRNRMGQQ